MSDEKEDRSAPGKVDALKPRWKNLSAERREALAFRWMDRCVRELVPQVCDRHGEDALAALLRGFAPLTTRAAVAEAKQRMTAALHVSQGPRHDKVFLAALSATTFLDDEPNLSRACFMAIMTSRLVDGDDRVQASLEADLAAEGC